MEAKTIEDIVERLAAIIEEMMYTLSVLGSLSEGADPKAICKVLGVIGEFHGEAVELRKRACALKNIERMTA